MSADWKPGDVAIVTLDDREGEFVGLRDTHGWATNRTDRHRSHAHWTNAAYVTPIRPLVVIDPEDREQAARLIALFSDQFTSWSTDGERDADKMQAALREFAEVTPQKPEEPTGLGAVVEDDKGVLWIRADGDLMPWLNYESSGDYWQPFDAIAVVRVLSEGTQP